MNLGCIKEEQLLLNYSSLNKLNYNNGTSPRQVQLTREHKSSARNPPVYKIPSVL